VVFHIRTGVALLCLLLVASCGESTVPEQSAVHGSRVNTVLGDVRAEGFARADGPREFSFPTDHGPHRPYRSEWWYITAVLQDAAGRDYGVQFTLFRQALTPHPTGTSPWQSGVAFLGHLAVSDVADRTHYQAQRFSRGHPELAGVVSTPRFSAWIEDWSLQQTDDERFTLLLNGGNAGEFAISLTLQQQQAIVLQGDQGWSRKGEGSASYYYSMPGLDVSGQLVLEGREVPVDGLAWLDREWSTSVLSAEVLGWDWFALQLDDGRGIMAFRLRRRDGTRDPFDHGMLIDPSAHNELQNDVGVQVLHPGDYALHPTRYWTDERGARWPVAWTLDLADEHFVVETLMDDQVMDAALVYWEGIVEVRAAGKRVGRGYMELTGYDAPRPKQ
jgi:predicted secreted hydrolase